MAEKFKKKKGKVHYKKSKFSNPELVKSSGCSGCEKVCIFKGNIIHPDSKVKGGQVYLCNTKKKEE